MVQRNNGLGSRDERVLQFEQILEALIIEFEGDLYYHEVIGILQLQLTRLILESHSIIGEDAEDDEDEEDDWGNFTAEPD
jgi:hypothetical protein